jgi:pimeloyl-ACP methyl ester carboxylesterase
MRTKSFGIAVVLLATAAPGIGHAGPTDAVELLPLLHSATTPGTWRTDLLPAVTPSAKIVDGAIGDWIGESARSAGKHVLSAGELIYSDHLFDAHGADDGFDADRVATLGPIEDAVPQTYRIEPLLQADAPGEVGAPNPYPAEEQYGDAGMQARADLVEVRLAADDDTVYVLARTSAMTSATDTALLILADVTDGSTSRTVPFNAGLASERADVAIFAGVGTGRAIDVATDAMTPIAVAADASGYVNAIEAAIPRALIERADGTLSLAIAAGNHDVANAGFKAFPGLTSRLANVAFRSDEPVRIWFDAQQALSLFAGTIDPFFTSVSTAALTDGVTQRLVEGPGYHERIFTSTTQISSEGGSEGVFQHYGVYLPTNYGLTDALVPATWWFHWRGGKAHSAAAMVPRFVRDMGEGLGGIVISPRGRGTSSWYLGRGMVDFNEVWDDAMSRYAVDRDRVYVSGHSMGGWASYLMPILYPDRFAASFPVSPPVTQGAWTGLDFPNCDQYRYDEYSFCYEWTNDSNPRVQHTRKLLENLRNVPIAIYAGGIDELVPVSGEIRQAERLVQLGYRHRLYIFPTYEHFTPPIIDEWQEGTRYFASHRRDADPARVSYVRDMPFERSVEIGPSQYVNPFPGLDFSFDRAYWMSGLTPADPVNGVARFEGRSLAKIDPSALLAPEAGGPAGVGQAGPFEMAGLAWLDHPLPAPTSNGFEVTLAGATTVQLDTARMGLDGSTSITGTVTTDRAATLRLAGLCSGSPQVSVNGVPTGSTCSSGILDIALPSGTNVITIT